MNILRLGSFFGALLLLVVSVAICRGASVVIQAESGTLGTNFANGNDAGTQFISNTNNNTATTPGIPGRVATYSVTFPEAGTYDLYARVRVGPGGATDDSFFYGNGFGAGFNIKSPTADADWITVNNVNIGGFTNSSDVVTGSGSAGTDVWKWINLSEYTGTSGEPPIAFTVPAANLTQTFQIGGREDGFDIDKFAFGTVDYNFTVANLDAGTDGTQQPSGDGSCTVQWGDVRQIIDGFGASSAWRSTWSTALANMLFSTNSGTATSANGTPYSYTGIGLSLLRTRIAPGGTTVEQSIMQMAQARGARVWSAPWSPAPAAQFKSNTDVNGGSFIGNAQNYQDYAAQMARYVVNMKNQYGVNLYAISVQNEPDANVTTYESCNWTGQQIHDFIPYLSSALAASNVGATKIMLPESQNWTDPQGLRLATMNDPATASLVSIIANHNYVANNASGDQTTPAAINNYGKALWETEVAKLSGSDSSINDGVYWAGRVHQFLTIAQANAWHYWWLIASNNEGLVDDSGPAKRMYTLGNFSRFVRPGFHRIGITNSAGPLQISAYKNLTNGSFVIVAINQTFLNYNQTFNLAGFPAVDSVTPWITSSAQSLFTQPSVTVSNASFTHFVPAKSVITFVAQAVAAPSNTPPTLTPVGDKAIDPGMTLVVTNVVTDTNVPAQQLTFSLLSIDPTNATINASNGVFTWRPLISQADSTNAIKIQVADNGTPSLSATNNFVIIVNPASQPTLSSIKTGAAQIVFSATGMIGPDYTLLTSTNLVNWQTLITANPTEMPFQFTETNLNEPIRFYRLHLGP